MSQLELLRRSLAETRNDTLQLFSFVPEAELHLSPGFGFRPVLWHLAHIGVFEAFWILQTLKGDAPLDEKYERLFDPIKTPRETSKDLPSRREMTNFLSRVRAGVESFLDALDDAAIARDAPDKLLRNAYVFNLVLEHERQHQETLAYLLFLIDPAKKLPPPQPSDAAANKLTAVNDFAGGIHRQQMIEIPAGACVVGATDEKSFAYDNELPPHTVELTGFRIAKLLSTNADFLNFIDEGGYARQEFWTPEAWAWRAQENIAAPLYWQKIGGNWHTRTMFETLVPLRLNHPVSGISWFEANAFARFSGKRLPTEAEWEKAAASNETIIIDQGFTKSRFAWGDAEPTLAQANFGAKLWDATPVGAFIKGASACGCLDMTGNVWEWTSDAFAPYAGFEAYPYPEYSQAWFDGDHKVLKGGSWATRASLLRTSFRNFFRRNFRIAFAGVRLAEDV